MLNRNCATDLLERGDFNVRVTLFDKNPKHYVPEAYKAAWIETIRDCLGGGIVHSNEPKTFAIKKPGQKTAYLYGGTFTQFIQKLESYFQKPTSIRITILGEHDRSWIILIPDFHTN